MCDVCLSVTDLSLLATTLPQLTAPDPALLHHLSYTLVVEFTVSSSYEFDVPGSRKWLTTLPLLLGRHHFGAVTCRSADRHSPVTRLLHSRSVSEVEWKTVALDWIFSDTFVLAKMLTFRDKYPTGTEHTPHAHDSQPQDKHQCACANVKVKTRGQHTSTAKGAFLFPTTGDRIAIYEIYLVLSLGISLCYRAAGRAPEGGGGGAPVRVFVADWLWRSHFIGWYGVRIPTAGNFSKLAIVGETFSSRCA